LGNLFWRFVVTVVFPLSKIFFLNEAVLNVKSTPSPLPHPFPEQTSFDIMQLGVHGRPHSPQTYLLIPLPFFPFGFTLVLLKPPRPLHSGPHIFLLTIRTRYTRVITPPNPKEQIYTPLTCVRSTTFESIFLHSRRPLPVNFWRCSGINQPSYFSFPSQRRECTWPQSLSIENFHGCFLLFFDC